MDLILEHIVHNLHDDFDQAIWVTSGFNEQKYLVIRILYSGFSLDEWNGRTEAWVKHQDAYRLARKLRIHLTDIPQYISNRLGSDNEFGKREDYERTFKNILDFLLDYDIKYSLKEFHGSKYATY